MHAHFWESILIQDWGFYFNNWVRRRGSSCQTSKCEEDDGYVRKPKRQGKTTVRSGFPSLHWLILPLRVRASEKRSLSQRFQFLKHLWQTALCQGIKRPAHFVSKCCAMLSFEKGKHKMALLRNTTLIFNKLDATKDVWRRILGNSAPPSAHFKEIITSSWSQLT